MDKPQMSREALETVGRCVRLVVDQQGWRPNDPLYRWTHHYGEHEAVRLAAPPGPPVDWGMSVVRVIAAPRPTYDVAVPMWIHEGDRSDLSLSIELVEGHDEWTGRPLDLHVL